MSENKKQAVTLEQMIEAHKKSNAKINALSKQVNNLITTGGEPNVITGVKVNGETVTVTDKAVDITVPTKVTDVTNDAQYQTAEQVTTAINAKVASTYKAGGSVAFADLPELNEANLGLVVDVTEEFTTTNSFVEGAGQKHPAGTNVAVVQRGETYKYDVLSGFVDLSGYQQKEEGKGLSSNDFSDEEKAKLAGIEFATDEEVAAELAKIYGEDPEDEE